MKIINQKLETALLTFEHNNTFFQEPFPKEFLLSEIIIKVSELTGLSLEEVLAGAIKVNIWHT